MSAAFHLLFLCRHSSIRAPLAVAISDRIAGSKVKSISSGVDPQPEPDYVRGLVEYITGQPAPVPTKLEELEGESFDLIVILGDKKHAPPEGADRVDRLFPETEKVAWDMPNPTNEAGLKKLEIELADRLRLLFLSKHLI